MPHIPVHPSAQKRHRQNLKRREHNRAARTQVRSAVKVAVESTAATDAAAAQEKLRAAISALDKAGAKGKMHRNTVARKIARLSTQYHKKHAQKAQA
jgi:small subunit ribosomal protein S20